MLSNFVFSRQDLTSRDRLLNRFFEILPGLTSWTILVGICLLSFLRPLVAAILIIAFDFYWLLRLFHMTIFLILAYLRLSIEKDTDWMAGIREIDGIFHAISPSPLSAQQNGGSAGLFGGAGEGGDGGNSATDHPHPASPILPEDGPAFFVAGKGEGKNLWKEIFSLWIHKRKIEFLKQSGPLPPSSDEIYHLVIFSVAKEGGEVLEVGVSSIANQNFSPKRILLMIALEERAEEHIKEEMQRIQEKYRSAFFDFLIALHPDGLPGEARVKGANVTYAAKEAARYFQAKQIPFENIIVSCFDADTVVHPAYFSCLTYHFMVYPKRNQASFQPVPVYHNNIWEAPAFSRVLDVGASFFQLIEATNSDRLVTFSSHSMSFKALVEVGFWPVDIISDDSAIFWKSLIHFKGAYRVIPMYTTLSMDVVSGATWRKTITNVYRQKRRWAWGVENFPIVMRGFLQTKGISFLERTKYGFKLFEDNVAWATWGFLLTFIGWLPALFAGREFSDSVLYYSAPRIAGIIFNLALVALATTIVLSLLLLPKKKVRFPILKRIGFAIEWLFVPIIVVFLSTLPALDAQTRLMFGKYMEFWVTEKERRS